MATTNAQVDKLIRFQRPDRALPYARSLTDATVAAIIGTDETTYVQTIARLETQRSRAARELAGEADVRAQLDRLPFARGQRIVAIGESTTADRLSWFEILRVFISSTRPDHELIFENLAISGATTTQALAGIAAVRYRRPDWLFCLLGTNDVQRLGTDGLRLVSQGETMRNLQYLHELAQLPPGAHWIWLTPTLVNDSLVAHFPPFKNAGLVWLSHDVAELSAELRGYDGTVIDTSPAFSGDQPHLDDGLHPTLSTQQAIAALVLAQLTM
jgi:acyl-CoA thioesterase-1